jgi:hypothetical protein
METAVAAVTDCDEVQAAAVEPVAVPVMDFPGAVDVVVVAAAAGTLVVVAGVSTPEAAAVGVASTPFEVLAGRDAGCHAEHPS